MSQPYPHDRVRARLEDGNELYEDAKKAMTEKGADLRDQAVPFESSEGETESSEQRITRLESEAEQRLSSIDKE